MSHRHIAVAVVAVVLQTACADSTAPASRTDALTPRAASLAETPRTPGERLINIFDRCDAPTFNAALGPGTCTRREAGVPFDQFIQQVTQMHSAPDWRFDPRDVVIKLGQGFVALNRGGEVHTFTEVEHFGGGIVPILNDLTGLKEVAPECNALAASDFLAPGGTFHDQPDEVGVELYQCCIHPWMRAIVRIRS